MTDNALIVSNGKAPTSELLRQEQQVREANREFSEAWVAVGDAIRGFYEGGEWKKSGFTDFKQYMNERGQDQLGCAKSARAIG